MCGSCKVKFKITYLNIFKQAEKIFISFVILIRQCKNSKTVKQSKGKTKSCLLSAKYNVKYK